MFYECISVDVQFEFEFKAIIMNDYDFRVISNKR